ncbi:MAG: gamma-glutamyltransferase, partial [Paucibacter sp.]|nr:gamma-glutamyltransferase [Roseateles sp.]
ARLFEPALRLAEQGFAVSPRLHSLLAQDRTLVRDPQARAYFFDTQGQAWPVGHVLRNPALAAIYRRLAAEGAEAFYQGSIARDMVARVRGHGANPGGLSEADLRAYQPRLREALCTDWREIWRVCGFPPPSSGHLTMMQILGMLPASDATHAVVLGQPGADWLHGYTEAARLAFADRDRYIGDPDFVAAPGGNWRTLLDPGYLARRAALIGPHSMGRASPGDPVPGASLSLASQPEQVEHGTSHVSVVDARGHSVSMTTTVESAFGARLMSDGGTGLPGGFMLNNQLTDFSFVPRDAQGRAVANRLEPGKRPRSSMTPTLVFDRRDGRLLMSVGSPGGAAIIHYVAKMLVATHDWGMNVQDAANLANFGSFNGPTALEKGLFPAATQEALKARGHQVQEVDLVSGTSALERQGGGWFGAADPRREGSVRGD